MASLGGEQIISSNIQSAPVRNHEEKLKIARERQNEERQRKIEELKAQAEAAQRYREQKEEERRRRIDDLRNREHDKRHQVEERKKAIIEAEKERREYILRKNQERETRLDTRKRNERSSTVFAFGSSTPRLLEPADFGTVSPSVYWGHRRSTSITNVAYTGASLSRRSSERELADGPKKRATSASGAERHDGSRSGNVTPGGSINTSRPGSAMSTSTTMSTSAFVSRRSVPSARKPRPVSIAGTGVSLLSLEEAKQKRELNKPPTPRVHSTPKRTSMSSSMTSSMTRGSSVERKTVTKKDSTPQKSISTSRTSLSKASSSEKLRAEKPPKSTVSNNISAVEIENPKTKEEKNALNTVKTEIVGETVKQIVTTGTANDVQAETPETPLSEPVTVQEAASTPVTLVAETEATEEKADKGSEKEIKKQSAKNSRENSEIRELSVGRQENDMTASMMAKSKITTEDEAKAALAERRRLAREEAERQAELERQRLEAERQADLQRQAEEEERQRKFEEESIRMAAEQRVAEEERLKQAIEEAEKREEEEKLKREDEEKQRVEREEAEKKAKEEAEKQRLEVAERLKREEKEREERRKRVEAIMSRTRRAGGNGATPNSTPTKENNDTSKVENQNSPSPTNNTQTTTETTITSNDNQNHTEQIPLNTPNTKVENDLEKTVLVPQVQTNAQAAYEQSVIDKESALMNSFSSMIIDENARNLQNAHQQQQQQQTNTATITTEIETNGKIIVDHQNDIVLHNTVANGNGHFDLNNKKDTNILVDVPSTDQLIDVSNESQQITNAVNFNNNNSLLATTATLVTADSHENKEISLL